MNLHVIWKQLCLKYASDKDLTDALWMELKDQYAAPDRHYHTLGHLASMFRLAHEYQSEIHAFDTLCFSVFYHDAIYVPGREDNEEKSAELAAEKLKRLSIPSIQIEKCRAQVLATESHLPTSDGDTQYLLDFDLAILGQEWEIYQEYSKRVRAEFGFLTDEEFLKGRKAVLLGFLGRDRIFQTSKLHRQLEQKARENIQRELKTMPNA